VTDLLFFKYNVMTIQVAYLAIIGGATVKDCTSRILHTVLDHDIALNISWSGRNTTKRGIQGLQLIDVIVGEFALIICNLVQFI
jgi:hypothetical protein